MSQRTRSTSSACSAFASPHEPLSRANRQAVVAALRSHGFAVIRIRGSHQFLRHPDGRATVVPVHAGETIGRGLMAKILRDADLSHEQLVAQEVAP